jgi:hypothetical protein
MNGFGVGDLVRTRRWGMCIHSGQDLEYFKEVEKKSFTLSHCWMMLKYYPKWQASFGSYKKSQDGANDSTAIDLEDGRPSNDGRTPWPRGHKASRRFEGEASFMALKNTLKAMMADKEEAYAKREERRCLDKEEHMLNFSLHKNRLLRKKNENFGLKRSMPDQELRKLRSMKK